MRVKYTGETERLPRESSSLLRCACHFRRLGFNPMPQTLRLQHANCRPQPQHNELRLRLVVEIHLQRSRS